MHIEKSMSDIFFNYNEFKLNYIFSFLSFNFIQFFLNIFMEINMANNFTAFTHAILSTILSLFIYIYKNNCNYLIIFSTGYFLYDIIFNIKYIKSPMNKIYIYHHLATIFYLHQEPITYRITEILGVGELSNLSSYFVYYYLKKDNNKKDNKKNNNNKKIYILKKIQFYSYSFIRFPIASYLLFDVLTNVDDIKPIIIMLPVYLMGIFWSYRLWLKL